MRHLFTLWNIVMIAITGWFAVSIGYSVLGDSVLKEQHGRSAAVSRSAVRSRETRMSGVDRYQGIIDRNLFGTLKLDRPKIAVVPEIDLKALKKTSLNLKLWGTISGDTESARAIIEVGRTRKQSLYKEGQDIEGARIRAILRKRVVLTRNGRDEVLEMGEDSSVMPVRQARREPEPNGDRIRIKRDVINSSLKDINDLMRQIRIRPNFENGLPAGLRVDRIRKDSIFNDMGIENGDVITGVNGSPIRSVDDALSFYDHLKSASDVSVQVKRDGLEETLNYNIGN